jgi:hypothetical protein
MFKESWSSTSRKGLTFLFALQAKVKPFFPNHDGKCYPNLRKGSQNNYLKNALLYLFYFVFVKFVEVLLSVKNIDFQGRVQL